MANFVLVIDADSARRRQFADLARTRIAPLDGLQIRGQTCGDCDVVWAAASSAPVSRASSADGVSILWGMARHGNERVDAARLQRLWYESPQRRRHAFDGFYAGLRYHATEGLVVGADHLGAFPVYYYSAPQVLLVGSSPELFRLHPAFRESFNPVGLVGMLLTMHIFDGQTLQKGVRRLASGHLLCWRPGRAVVEEEQFTLRASTKYFDLPFSAQVEILDQVIGDAVARQTDEELPCSLLLSGGLDSRLLAGYLDRQGVPCDALTLGASDEEEMQCAKRVAKRLGWPHRSMEIPADGYPRWAEQQARWEHVTGGFNNIINWGIVPRLKHQAPRLVMGHMLDAAVGTSTISWAYSTQTRSMSFETFFARLNAWGLSPASLRRLLRPEIFAGLVEETVDRIHSRYHSYAESEAQRAWCFNLQHRQRFHVGSVAWVLSFGSWPVVPALDRELLNAAGAMPAATIAERRGQIELLCRRFPQLAALPLDRNTGNLTPLQPRLRYLLRQYTLGRLQSKIVKKRKERRYYPRIYDLNGEGWRAVRQRIEPCREAALAYFNKEALDELLPPPSAALALDNVIIDASGRKSLMGFMLWLAAREGLRGEERDFPLADGHRLQQNRRLAI